MRPGALRAASFTGPKQDRRTSFLLQEAHPEDTGPAPDPVRAVEKTPSSELRTVLLSREVFAPLSPLVRRAPTSRGASAAGDRKQGRATTESSTWPLPPPHPSPQGKAAEGGSLLGRCQDVGQARFRPRPRNFTHAWLVQ